jgi:bifunctional DNA primase/polymerase-like protein
MKTAEGAIELDAYLRGRSDRCPGCGYHPDTQGHHQSCRDPRRLPELNMWPLPWAAYFYASCGIPVHPLRPGAKEPATAHGVNDASLDLDQIRVWWNADPRYNIGLRCGSPSMCSTLT